MSEPSAPSVNSWLEDELYHQYLYDRQTVDSGWKQVFEADGLIRKLKSAAREWLDRNY